MEGDKRFDKKRKFIPRYVGPYRILNHFLKVSYAFELPTDFTLVHQVFCVSLQKKRFGNPSFDVTL